MYIARALLLVAVVTAQSEGCWTRKENSSFVYIFHDVVLTVLFVLALVEAFTLLFALLTFVLVVALVLPVGTRDPEVERHVHEPVAPMVVTPQIGW